LSRRRADRPDLAVEHVNTALRLSPIAKVNPAFLILGGAHFLSRRFDAALPERLRAIQDDPCLPLRKPTPIPPDSRPNQAIVYPCIRQNV